MTDATAAVSPLRRRMIDDMSLRNLSPATQRSYLDDVSKFSRYSGRPRPMSRRCNMPPRRPFSAVARCRSTAGIIRHSSLPSQPW